MDQRLYDLAMDRIREGLGDTLPKYESILERIQAFQEGRGEGHPSAIAYDLGLLHDDLKTIESWLPLINIIMSVISILSVEQMAPENLEEETKTFREYLSLLYPSRMALVGL